MDLAKYCVQAVLVEGRSVREVAAATGTSKSWVQRHVERYRLGGDEALVPRKRGPKGPCEPDTGRGRGFDREVAQVAHRQWLGRRVHDDRVAP